MYVHVCIFACMCKLSVRVFLDHSQLNSLTQSLNPGLTQESFSQLALSLCLYLPSLESQESC